jgi:hypothetical protein
MADHKRGKREGRSFTRVLNDMGEQEADFERFKRSRGLIPPSWHSVARKGAK